MKDIQAVVFDLYGTLIYLAKETKPYTGLFADIGLKTSEEIRQARRIALTEDFDDLAGLVERIKPGAKIEITKYEQKIEQERASATVYPETRRVLGQLRERELKLGLISNLASPYKKPFFELGLENYFQEVLFSCEVGLIKPDSKIYQKMMEKLEIDPAHVLMTGDKIKNDVDGPKSIGMNAVYLDRKGISANSINTLKRRYFWRHRNSPIKSEFLMTLEEIFQYL